MGEIILNYSGGPNVIRRVFIRERGRHGSERRCDNGSRGWSDETVQRWPQAKESG